MKDGKSANQTASLQFEHRLRAEGFLRLVGLDEAGRGTWAGPVTAAAVWLPVEQADLIIALAGVRDSKQLAPRVRARLSDVIKSTATAWGIGSASSVEIDLLGIVPATRLAMKRALEGGELRPDCLLLDAIQWPEMAHIKQVSLIHGDARSLSIAAASILAKTWRDQYMIELDRLYPQYGFAAHKGYGTPGHQEALRLHGPCPEHRMSFAPFRQPLLPRMNR